MTNCSYDPNVPSELKNTQTWFASIITRPFVENSKMLPLSPTGVPMVEEAKQFIVPSPTMQPYQRIELYNQQYWWRLLNVLHNIYPLVTRLFGHYLFNQQIAIPFLQKYPPATWSLNEIGNELPKWIEDEYNEKDKQLVLDSARVDLAFNKAFVALQEPPLEMTNLPVPGDITSLLDKKLFLQPHITLFNLDYELFEFRKKFVKEGGDYWIHHNFPKLEKKKKYHFILFRTHKNNLSWDEISEGEYFLLSQFQQGKSIDEACDLLEKAGKEIFQSAFKNLHKWFQEWVIRRWLVLKP